MRPNVSHSHPLRSVSGSPPTIWRRWLARAVTIAAALIGPVLLAAAANLAPPTLAAPLARLGAAHAQTLDVVVDAAVGSGLLLGRGDDGTAAGHTPVFAELEAGFIFDRDRSVEWVLGTILQLEDTPGVGLVPQVRLLRSFGLVEGFVSAGVPVFVFPFTRFGAEVGGGLLYPIVPARFALAAQLAIDVYFAGSDLPEDTTVIMFNLGLGGRVYF